MRGGRFEGIFSPQKLPDSNDAAYAVRIRFEYLMGGRADEQCKPTPHIITVATSWLLIVLRWLPRRQLAAEQSRDGNPGCICT